MSTTDTLANGAQLTPETFANFIQRLNHHCRGEGVSNHCTADAIFNVEQKRIITGIDRDYTENWVVYTDGESQWFSPQEYWDDSDEGWQSEINEMTQEEFGRNFTDLNVSDQWDFLENLDDHSVTGYSEEWSYVNSHFTREAADAYIRRKRHDYRELRIYVDANIYCWEFNTIKEALMDGRLVLLEKTQ